MSAYDVPAEEIAASLLFSESELERRFSEELATGLALKSASVIVATWELARQGKWAAISILLKRLEAEEARQAEMPSRRRRR